jgi:sugar-specific transcriptional regulator TrmB
MLDIFLDNFGLTHNEQKIYLFLLGHGEAIASLIAKRLNIKRVTVYASLETLKKKELVHILEKNNVTYFEAVDPEAIVRICQEEVNQKTSLRRQAERFLPYLQKIQSEQVTPVFEVAGHIKYYQGIEAVKRLIDETLDEGPTEQLCFGLNQYHISHLWDDWSDYTKRRTAVGMNVRSIQPDSQPARAYRQRDSQELRHTLLVPSKRFPAQCELNVIGDMIALFSSHGDQPTGMKLYNAQMAELLRSLFNLAWERAEGYDRDV